MKFGQKIRNIFHEFLFFVFSLEVEGFSWRFFSLCTDTCHECVLEVFSFNCFCSQMTLYAWQGIMIHLLLLLNCCFPSLSSQHVVLVLSSLPATFHVLYVLFGHHVTMWFHLYEWHVKSNVFWGVFYSQLHICLQFFVLFLQGFLHKSFSFLDWVMCVLVFFLLPIMFISSWIFVYVQHLCLCSCVVVLVLHKKLADEN